MLRYFQIQCVFLKVWTYTFHGCFKLDGGHESVCASEGRSFVCGECSVHQVVEPPWQAGTERLLDTQEIIVRRLFVSVCLMHKLILRATQALEGGIIKLRMSAALFLDEVGDACQGRGV